mgnify:CR=1 FL=1
MSDKLKIECFLEAIGEYVAARQDGDTEAMKRAAILAERQIEEAVNECVAELVTVEDIKAVLHANEGRVDDAAQAVMKLLRKE